MYQLLRPLRYTGEGREACDEPPMLKRLTPHIIFSFALTLCFLPAVPAEAKSVSWTMPSRQVCSWAVYDTYSVLGTVTIGYAGNVLNQQTGAAVADGATVPVGTVLQYVPKARSNSDISWTRTGGTSDTPLGYWVAGAAAPAPKCAAQDKIDTLYYLPLAVNPPAVTLTHTGTATLSCNAAKTVCTVTGPGTIQSVFNFAATSMRFHASYIPPANRVNTSPACTYITACPVLAVPLRTIPYTFNAVATNKPPLPPTITGETDCATNGAYTYSFVSTDPDGDTIRYGVDWDKNGTVDQYLPGSGYVASGTSQNAPYTWVTSGTRSFQARTEDSKGAVSGWTNYSVSVTTPPNQLPTAIIITPSSNQSVVQGTTLSFSGSGSDPDGTINGYEWRDGACDTGTIVSSAQNFTTSQLALGTHQVFLRVRDDDNAWSTNCPTRTITVNPPPVTPAPTLAVTLSASPATGNVPLTSTVTAVVSGTATGNVTYTFYCHRNDTGTTITTPHDGTFTGAETLRSTVCTYSSSGAFTPKVVVSRGGLVREARTTVSTSATTAPTLTIAANPTTILSGQSSTLTWTSSNTTSCTASGGWSGGKALFGTQGVTPAATTTYTMTCTGPGGSVTQNAIVTVTAAAAAPTLTLTANPTTVPSGSASVLTWSSANATSCAAFNGWTGSKALSGTESTGALTSGRTYTLTCTGPGGSVTRSVSVSIQTGCTAGCSSTWGSCSKSCGGGTQSRTCVRADCSTYNETRTCNTSQCPDYTEVSP